MDTSSDCSSASLSGISSVLLKGRRKDDVAIPSEGPSVTCDQSIRRSCKHVIYILRQMIAVGSDRIKWNRDVIKNTRVGLGEKPCHSW